MFLPERYAFHSGFPSLWTNSVSMHRVHDWQDEELEPSPESKARVVANQTKILLAFTRWPAYPLVMRFRGSEEKTA